MTDEAWNTDFIKSLGVLLSGEDIEEVNERGEPVVGDSLLVLLNAHEERVPFRMPALADRHHWHRVLDTADPRAADRLFRAGGRYPLQGRSLAVFKVTRRLRDRRKGTAETALSIQREPAPVDTGEPVTVDG